MAKFIIDTDKCTCVPYDNYSSYSEGYKQGKKDMKQDIISKTNWLDNSYSEVRKHGSWFLLDECSNEGVYCSVCCKKVYKTDYANQKLKSRYCPNCGAIMDLDGE